ncbi:MAG: fructosamine kinase family protein [Cyanobacteriota bacterium]|nr:fructosamine kinase family protein [Cyanobacteriota bacterium]
MVRFPADPLADWLHGQLGVDLLARIPVGGGCIHSAWCLRTSGDNRLFVKTNRAETLPLLEAEAEGLAALARVAPAALRIPEPLALGLAGEEAVLVLPWLELARGGGAAESWAECGANLARLHRLSLQPEGAAKITQGFGWSRDNFIGASPQCNGWREAWSVFFAECRLQPQLVGLARQGQPMRGAERLLEHLPAWLAGHAPQPCLVHGDLWSGNAALLAGGGACLFDPAVHRGDREVDLAMARLFGGFPEAFFKGYEEEWPLPGGWRERVTLYNLYHLLNHANLFGGGYGKQAQKVIDSLLGLQIN